MANVTYWPCVEVVCVVFFCYMSLFLCLLLQYVPWLHLQGGAVTYWPCVEVVCVVFSCFMSLFLSLLLQYVLWLYLQGGAVTVDVILLLMVTFKYFLFVVSVSILLILKSYVMHAVFCYSLHSVSCEGSVTKCTVF